MLYITSLVLIYLISGSLQYLLTAFTHCSFFLLCVRSLFLSLYLSLLEPHRHCCYSFPGFQCQSYPQFDLTHPILIQTTLSDLSFCVTAILSSWKYWSKPFNKVKKYQSKKNRKPSSRCFSYCMMRRVGLTYSGRR